MIQFDSVTKRYSNGHIGLSDVTFTLNKGEMCFLTGHSGAGKSTLLKLIVHLEKCSHGQVIVNDHNLNRISKRRIPYFRREVGIIFQDPKLLNERTVF